MNLSSRSDRPMIVSKNVCERDQATRDQAHYATSCLGQIVAENRVCMHAVQL